MDPLFTGKKVLVTGASGGLGFEIARDFLRAGATVGGHYRTDAGTLRELEREGKERFRAFQADFARTPEVLDLWKRFVAWTGGSANVLVNAAAEATAEPIATLSEETWDRAFQVNAKAPFLLGREALAVMSKNGGGRILNLSSIGVVFGGSPTTAHYSASKAALEAITRSLALEGAKANVLVNVVRVGVADTALHAKLGRTEMKARAAKIPLERMARPGEVSAVVLFLASPAASFVTGAVIPVAGGE